MTDAAIVPESLNEVIGIYIRVQQDDPTTGYYDDRSYCAGVVAGMAPMQWEGVKANHERRIAEYAERGVEVKKATDVKVKIGDRDVEPESYTFAQFEFWLNYGVKP